MRSGPRLLVSLWLVLGAAAAAQDRPPSDSQQPTFRTGIQSVRVDLYVTRDGEPVRDLRQDEVQVFEDGVAQRVETFERITFAEPGSARVVDPQTAAERRKLATDHRARLFVLFLTAPEPRATAAQRQVQPRQTQSQVIQMLNSMLGPDDVIAVMTPYMRIEDLTFHRRVPQDDELWFRDLNKDPKHSRWDACFPPGGGSPNGEMKARYRELVTFEALEGLVTHLSGLRDERKHILVMSDGFRLYTKNPRLPSRGQPESGGFPIGGGSGGIGAGPRAGDRIAGSRIPYDCEQDLKDLASLDHAGRLDQIANYARRTNASFYPISLLRTASDPTRNLRLRGSFENNTTLMMQSSLRDLAEETDGLPIVNTSNVEEILRRVVTTTSSYYLVGYTPASTTADGRFRRITVKVSRPDTSVSARTGYVVGLPAPTSVVPVETRKPPDRVDVSMRALNVSGTSALHVRPAVWTRSNGPDSQTTSVWIDAELDPQLRRQRLQAEGGTVEMILRPLRGGDPISRQLPVTTTATNVEFDLRGPDALAPGEYSVQLQLTGAGAEPVGEFLRVSVPESSSSLGEALLLRRGPATGPRYLRTADPRFYRTDRLRLELPTDSRNAATARLLDRRGGALTVPVQVSERADDSGLFRWIVADLPLTSIAPGDYAVEVTQGSATRLTAFRVVP
jgi:VWFA-related protein